MPELNLAYLRSWSGALKFVQIALSVILLFILRSLWKNEGSCFGYSDVEFLFILNLIVFILNLLTFAYHLIGGPFHKQEWKLAAGYTVLFALVFCWNLFGHYCFGFIFLLMFLQLLFFVSELLGLCGRCDCYIRVRSFDYHLTFGYEEMERVHEDSRTPSEYGSI